MQRFLPIPAFVLSVLALLVAVSGTSYAAAKISGKNIRGGTVTGKQIKDGSISSADLKRSSIDRVDLSRQVDGRVEPGETIGGRWSVNGSNPGKESSSVYSLVEMPEEIPYNPYDTVVVYDPTTNTHGYCAGDADSPRGRAGTLCIYVGYSDVSSGSVLALSGAAGPMPREDFLLKMRLAPSTSASLSGTWAYTAP